MVALLPTLPASCSFSGHALVNAIVCCGGFAILCLPQAMLGSARLAHTLPRV